MIDWLIAAMNLFSALVIIWILVVDRNINTVPVWHRFGLAFVAAGLVGQLIDIHAIGLWTITDAGIAILALMYVFRRAKIKEE